ncbi:MAG TPA: [acyl-carrier-protein] S-malonyltransferase [Opitutae bacterium]|nr:[acyl-carrier-protein] S-malonyltransferase [Opitutae bacterium]
MNIALMFSGQGAHKVSMGKDLYENGPIARDIYDRSDEILGWKLSEFSFEGPEEMLTKTGICQPALFTHGYAVYQLLNDRGYLEDAQVAMGLSLGEITAFAVSEVFDFETGLRIVAERGRLMQEACDSSDGSMAAVIGVDRETVAAFCQEHGVEMANLNCPGQIVISGESEKIAAAVEDGKAKGFRRVMPLNVAGAYHSRLMQPAVEPFREFLSGIEFNEPKYKVFSTTTGEEVSSPEAILESILKAVVSPVYWEDCMVAAANDGVDKFYELGVNGILKGQLRRVDKDLECSSYETWEDISAVTVECG